MGTILKISGKRFDVDNFIIGWRIKPSAVHRKGDLRSKSRNEKVTTPQIIYDISDKGFNDLKGQVNETTKFLKRNKKHLQSLSTYKTIENISIDFAFDSRVGRRKVGVQIDYLPADLIRLCGDLGIGIILTQW